MIVRELINKIGFSLDVSQLHAVETRINKLSHDFNAVGKRLSIAITAPLTGIAVMALKTAEDIDKMRLSFETWTRSADTASQLVRDLIKFTSETPFGLNDVEENARKLLAYGISSKDLIPTLRMLGNVATGVGMPLNEIVSAYGRIQARGNVIARDMMRLRQAGKSLTDALIQVTGLSRDAIGDMLKKNKISAETITKAFEAMTSSGGRFYGEMDKRSKTLGVALKNLKNSTVLLLADLGITIEKTLHLGENIGKLTDAIFRLSDWFSRLSPQTKSFLVIVSAIAAAIGPAILSLGTFLGLLKFAVGGLAAFSGVSVIALGWIALAVAALGALVLLVDDFMVYMRGGNSVIGKFLEPWARIGPKVMAYISMYWDAIKGTVMGIVEYVQGILQLIVGVITGNTELATKGAHKIIVGFLKMLYNLGALAGEIVIGIIVGLIPAIFKGLVILVKEFDTMIRTFAKTWVNIFIDFLVVELSRAGKYIMDNTLLGVILKMAGAVGKDIGGMLESGTGIGPSPALAAAGFSGGAGSPYLSTAPSSSMSVAKNVNVKSTINLTLPVGTEQQHIDMVQRAAESSVQEIFDRHLRGVMVNNSGDR
jgi:hypothetical protein